MPDGPRLPTTWPLILGAGPAGLALACELKRRGVEARLLEKGPQVGHSWRTMPTHLTLVSPWNANQLSGADPGPFPSNHTMRAQDFAAALEAYAELHKLPVVTKAGAIDVTRTAEGEFSVRTHAGNFRAPFLVNATGCFSNPFIPAFPGVQESSLPRFHFATYRDAEQVRTTIGHGKKKVLIVGKRLSAGQAMVEFVDAGFDVALSCRGPIRFGAGSVGTWVMFRIHNWLERLELRCRGRAARGFEAVMPGGRTRRLIEHGVVKIYPDVARFDDRRVVCSDGRFLEPDAVVFATGFRPALAHLGALGLTFDPESGRPALNGFESADVGGLFFLGLDGLRSFRSRFIRGIREDAPLLAEQIVARLRAGRLPPREPETDTRREQDGVGVQPQTLIPARCGSTPSF